VIPFDTLERDPWHFARPKLADAYLDAFDLKLSSARGMFARRRMGKTEFLRMDLLPNAAARGYLVAYTNLWDNRAAPEAALLAALMDALEPQGVNAVIAKLRIPVKRVKATAKIAGGAEGSLEAELGSPSSGAAAANALQQVLKVLDKQKKTLLLVIDEAQILAHAAHGDFAHALRAALDIRKDKVKVVFAGSSETTLRAMFARSSEPFYNWAALEPFPLLDEEFVKFTIQKMNSIAKNRLTLSQGKKAFDELHRTPEFFKRFVEQFLVNPFGGEAAALERTKATVFSDEHFKKQWDALSLTDQAVVAMLAVGESDFHAAAVLERLTDSLGKPVTKNTMAHALRRLQMVNIVTKLAYGEYHIEDEAYAEWVRRRGRPSGSS
jgi:hypothetical protein